MGKPLFRKTKDGKIFEWKVENDASLCTLQEAFEKVNPSISFNIELKFDDQIEHKEDELVHVLQVILNVCFQKIQILYFFGLIFAVLLHKVMIFLEQVVSNYAKDRPILFSSFQPDAAILIRKLQSNYPVRSLLIAQLCLSSIRFYR